MDIPPAILTDPNYRKPSEHDNALRQSDNHLFQPHTLFNSRGKQYLGEFCEKCIPFKHRCISNEPDDSDWAPYNIDKFPVQITDDEQEKEAPHEEEVA